MVMAAVRPDVAVFALHGTLFDPSGLERVFAAAGQDAGSWRHWLTLVQRDGMALTASGTFATFDDVARFHLRQLGADASRVIEALDQLEPFSDVRPALEQLGAAHVRVVTLTNSSAAGARRLLERAGLSARVERSFDAAEVMAWKPARPLYEHVAAELGVVAERLALISANPWELHGASAAGLLGAWVDREGSGYPEYLNAPVVSGPSLVEVVEQLTALNP
jgi:2-haloacid dehalogenase